MIRGNATTVGTLHSLPCFMWQMYLILISHPHDMQNCGSLRMELQTVSRQLEEMQKRKKDRKKLFSEVLEQINHILKELSSHEGNQSLAIIDDTDLSLKKLEDFKTQLHDLEREKV